jgi:hypothetical protein
MAKFWPSSLRRFCKQARAARRLVTSGESQRRGISHGSTQPERSEDRQLEELSEAFKLARMIVGWLIA